MSGVLDPLPDTAARATSSYSWFKSEFAESRMGSIKCWGFGAATEVLGVRQLEGKATT